ncbi:MAG: YfhO family protein [Bacteroidales bacterium]|nr:YfhO family protein [Bacteroidales bacterium]
MGTLKKILPDMLAVVAFVIIAFAYFFVPVRDGKVLSGHDHTGAVGSGTEIESYMKSHDGEIPRWTNTLFSGMPTYQMAPTYQSSTVLAQSRNAYKLWLPDVVAYVFMMLLGFYIMLRAFNFKTWMAALGAVLWAFSSYYFIIIAAGHIWKVLTLCFIPPTIGGMVLCYRGKYVWGMAVTGIFTALQIFSNHIQMTYYFMFVLGFMALAYLIQAFLPTKSYDSLSGEEQNETVGAKLKSGFMQWVKATGCVLIGGILGVLVNLSNIYHTWEYSKESMRSKSELTAKTKDAENMTDGGLDRDYITQWSYGGDELLTLMVPNAKGGASMPLSMNQTAMSKADSDLYSYGIYDAFPQYHGEQPGTSGPVYIGAFVCFLFILGLIIVKGPMKWCLLCATLLSFMLSMGHNFMWFTNLFLDYVPMYDKFRTVASILVIAEFTMPLLGLMALKKIADKPEILRQSKTMTAMCIALGMTAGVCLVFWMFPGLAGSFTSTADTQGLHEYVAQGYMDQGMADRILVSIATMRKAMFTADCFRSFFIIMIGFAALMVYRTGKMKSWMLVSGLTVLCLIDMWSVNKRYLNNDMFVDPQPVENNFPLRHADEMILQDEALDYRVLSLSEFTTNNTSYYHKSLGGYHAAKLRRYQELIDAHIGNEMRALPIYEVTDTVTGQKKAFMQQDEEHKLPVLNMLNMKYVIINPNADPVLNPDANGNAWFVDKVQYVDNADDELADLGKIDTKHTAVANKQFKDILGEAKADSTASVEMTSYEANELKYTVSSKAGGVLIFSEIFYPGWTATVDGKEVEIARADYVLRAIKMEAGKHEVVLTFDPQSVHTTETIAFVALGILAVILLLAFFLKFKHRNEGKE